MKWLPKSKRIVVKSLLLLCCVMPALFSTSTVVAAMPVADFLTNPQPGQPCTIATDGSTGIIQSDGHTCCPAKTANSNTGCFFAKYINPFVELLSAAVGIIVIIAIIIGAVEYTTSGGDPQRTASGKQHIMNALLALVAYAILYAFLQFLVPGGLFHG